jgi:hypothetical protein
MLKEQLAKRYRCSPGLLEWEKSLLNMIQPELGLAVCLVSETTTKAAIDCGAAVSLVGEGLWQTHCRKRSQGHRAEGWMAISGTAAGTALPFNDCTHVSEPDAPETGCTER